MKIASSSSEESSSGDDDVEDSPYVTETTPMNESVSSQAVIDKDNKQDKKADVNSGSSVDNNEAKPRPLSG
jgi:hypothetical protein